MAEENVDCCAGCIYEGPTDIKTLNGLCQLNWQFIETNVMETCPTFFSANRAREIIEADRAGRRAVDRAMAPRGSRP
jgi:hypothetical protein